MILWILIAIPLVAALLSALSGRARFGAAVTLLGALATLGCTVRITTQILARPAHTFTALPHWVGVDALSTLILLLVAVVYGTAALFSIGSMQFESTGQVRRYYLHFNLFVLSMLLIPVLQEPNLVWIAVELTTLFSVLLVGFEDTHEALEAAWKYVVLTVMGAAIALFGFLILYWAARRAGTPYHTWTAIQAKASQMSPILLKAAFLFILIGLGAKIGLVPLHTWLPDAHSQAPTPVCALLSGIETTTVLYVVLRLIPIVSSHPALHPKLWIIVFGLISLGTAAFLLIGVRDYKRLFAFSTVEHMGLILATAGLGSLAAHQAAMLQIVGHTLTKSFCFYTAGCLFLLTGTREIRAIHGLIRHASFTAIAFLLGGLAIAGAPPFVLFLSEFAILKAGFQQGAYWVTGLFVVFLIIAFFAILNPINQMVFGSDESSRPSSPKSLPISAKLTLLLSGIPILILGIYLPSGLQKLITLAAAAMGG